MRIPFESEGFSLGGPVSNGFAELTTSWDDLLWAAVTVGRPNRQYVFAHGPASHYEALFRWSLVRMALEQAGPGAWRVRRTLAARTLDPSEKGAVNYFLGLAVGKLFADQLLQAPWLLHLDVFRPFVNAVLTGRSRPDLVGQTLSGEWIALECKGRLTPPNADTKDKAKQQAKRVVSVNGARPTFAVGAITFFKNERLQFFWRDPEPGDVANPVEVEFPTATWRYHYSAALVLLQSMPDAFRQMHDAEVLATVPEADVQLGIHPTILRALENPNVTDVRPKPDFFTPPAPYHRDGIAVVAGESWRRPFDELLA
jgi:hypothetical protein